MGITVEKTGASCGAFVTGIDLTQDISADLAGELREILTDLGYDDAHQQQLIDAGVMVITE